MATIAAQNHIAVRRRAIAACLSLLSASASVPASDVVSRFLDLEAEIPVTQFGVNLDIAATSKGEVYLSSESRGGIWRLAENSPAWTPLIHGNPGPDVPRHPESIDTDSSGDIWASDADRHRAVVISPVGRVIQTYSDAGRILRKPSLLSVADEEHVGVWIADNGALVLLAKDSAAITPFPAVPKSDYCVLGDPVTAYCVQADRKTLSRHASGKATGTWELTGPYARIGDLELAPDGDIYLTDTPGRRIFAVSDDLKSAKRFRLYESLLQTPTRLTATADRLWLVDEGRKAVMQFRLRTAETAWEHALLGEEYLALSLHEAALRELEIARGLGLSRPDLELNVGIALYGLGRYQDALTTWRKLGDIPETQDVMGLWRGNALFRLGRYEDAVRAYDAVREESADGTRAVFNLGQARLALGQYGPAKMQFQRLLQRVPGNAFAKVGLARAHIGLGEIERAVPLLVEVASEGPAADVARYHLGHLRLTTGEVEAALPLLERAAKQGPYFRAALRDLIEANRRLGDTERARFYEQRLESLREDTDTLAAFILEDRL